MRHISLIIAVLALAVAGPAIAGKRGNGNGGGNNGGGGALAASGSCTLSGTTLSAQGLPVGTLLNLMVSSASGGWNQVLGYTDDGTWSMTVPAPAGGTTTYEFASKTWGPSGSPHYDVYASCSS